MLAALRHRGPDDEGTWRGEGAWLGHRRLSIIDLSPAGHQPMVSADGRWVLSLNGEIYNFEAMRRDLDAERPVSWRGHSDSEVLLECVARFGVSEALSRVRGMFAFAAWDRSTRTVYLARDPLGEKPLCYRAVGGELAFASEIGALEACAPAMDLCPDALSLYFRYGYIPAPYAIFAGTWKLPPGSVLMWREGEAPTVSAYYSLARQVEAGRTDPLTDDDAAVDALDALLRSAVGDQMTADVPLGAFLSGGVDSSLVVAIMQSLSSRAVETFTLGFDAPDYDEAPHAADVARHLGTRHTEHYVSMADAQAIAPLMGEVFDEPFADSSQIPTFLISRMARGRVTVSLTGDGGDEVFGGYVRYPGVPKLWDAFASAPFRRELAMAVNWAPLGLINAAAGVIGPLAAGYSAKGRIGPNVRRAAGWMTARTFDDLYERTMTAWNEPATLLRADGPEPGSWRPAGPCEPTRLERMMWRDGVDYLPGDILCKVDRAAMAHGLETRAPLLDPRLVAFAWRAPASMKIRAGQTKWLPRRVLDRYVPRALIERPKMGFSVPLHDWLTGGLRPWAEDLLESGGIERQGYLRPSVVASVWRRFVAGDTSVQHQVWCLLMFQSWLAARGR
jgi:asparagine synthase (glutamine-hydrolysing)